MIFHFYSVDYCSMSSSIIYKNNIEMRKEMGQRLLTATEKYGELDRDEQFSLL